MDQMVVIVVDSATLMYGFLEESSVSLKKWSKIYQRLFLGSILVYFMLLSNVFKGNIVKELNNPLIFEDSMYVSDVVESDKKVIYYESIHAVYRKYANDTELIINKLSKRRVECWGLHECFWSIIEKDRVMIIRENYAKNARALFWDNNTGSDLLHIVPEVPFSFFASITVNKGSPYVNKLNEMILQCTEAGIVQHGLTTAEHSLRLKHLRRYIVGEFIPEESKKPINMKNIDMIVFIFLIMLLLSTVMFFCEIIFHKIINV
ncbi:uncharacterized protein LOC129786870 [Lutzomyia longipalpis]|uniref:uncharacterized protein LOC129786870 n=1 Tax=Lutzomyia longipalpis TaxID=7200 RepID=UPI002483FF32|nr:uncharacterized protein LOC129786870 [Lutzomyia longipalpis]